VNLPPQEVTVKDPDLKSDTENSLIQAAPGKVNLISSKNELDFEYMKGSILERAKKEAAERSSGANGYIPTLYLMDALINQINPAKLSAESFELNSAIIEKILLVLFSTDLNLYELVRMQTKLVKKLAGQYLVIINKEQNLSLNDWIFLGRPISEEVITVRLLAELARRIGTSDYFLPKKVAKALFPIANHYRFGKYLSQYPQLQNTYKRMFRYYAPAKDSSLKELFTAYEALSSINIKVPKSWHEASLQALLAYESYMPISLFSSLYRYMLEAGVPASDVVEEYIYNYLEINKEAIDLRDVLLSVESIAYGLSIASLNMEMGHVNSHFKRLDRFIETTEVNIFNSFRLRFFYTNAVHRFNLFKDKNLPFTTHLVFKEELAQPTSLELKTEGVLKKLYTNLNLKKEVHVLDSLPRVDFYEPTKGWLVEADGHYHDTVIISLSEVGEYSLEIVPGRDLDIITKEIYEKLGFRHIRVNYRIFKLPENEQEAHIRKLIEAQDLK